MKVGPSGSENFKTLLLQLGFFINQTFSEYRLWQSSQKLLTGILKNIFFC